MKITEVVEETIKEYNKYRRPIAEAKILRLDDEELTLEVSGTLCHTCGFVDYLEDFVYEMERVTNEYRARLENYEMISDDRFVVKYRIERIKT